MSTKPQAAELATSPDARYDPSKHMVGQRHHGHPYCTTLPAGTWVHATVPSLDYALTLLRRGTRESIARALDVLRAVVQLQDTDPLSPTVGVWPWYLEEPLSMMKPPDLNWADFCGARLAEALILHRNHLSPEVDAMMRTALHLAAAAIVKRDVGPGYTNIAIMGGAVTAAAGELLGDIDLVHYGRARLGRVVAHTDAAGGFAEYNSPPYTTVALHECERVLLLVHDEVTRSLAERLLRLLWESIAEHFHPGTQQWAGPHSRAYSSYIQPAAARTLSRRTGVSIRVHPSLPADAVADDANAVDQRAWPCPVDLRSRFQELPQRELVVRRQFISKPAVNLSVTGTTWMTDAACLGSVNYANARDQRRALIAYWRTAADPAVVLRLRCLHDGYDFSSMLIRSVQDGPRVLSSVTLLTNMGDRAHHLDLPARPGVFTAEDFRVCYELTGVGVSARQLDARRFELSAGEWRAVIDTTQGQFGDRTMDWQLRVADGNVAVEIVCYAGARREFDFSTTQCQICAGLQLLAHHEPAQLELRCATDRRADRTVSSTTYELGALKLPLAGTSEEYLLV